jgi:predicted ribosome quality control (RQC) complex YloA/Tae2 family protein
VPEEIERTRTEQQLLCELLERAGDPGVDPDELEAEASARGLLKERQTVPQPGARRAPEPRLPYRSFRGARGSEIRVGRSARDNDELSLRRSRGNDVWLHTAEAPGSHVVLRLEREPPDEEEVLDAAHLAVHFSPLRGAPRADVHVARCKEVKKPRRAPAGLVTLSGGKVLRVRVEPERLERLLRGAPGAAADEG